PCNPPTESVAVLGPRLQFARKSSSGPRFAYLMRSTIRSMTDRPVPRLRFAIASLAAAVLVLLSTQAVIPQTAGRGPEIAQQVRERTDRGERVRVLVELNVPGHVPEGNLPNN